MNDYAALLAWGLVAGPIVAVVFHTQLKEPNRNSVMRWCLKVGGIALLFFSATFLWSPSFVSPKSLLGLGFIGIPALIAGLILLFLKPKPDRDES